MPAGALACRGCGSDAETSWHPDATARGLDLPAGYGGEEEFDYDAFVRDELGVGGKRGTRHWRKLGALALVVLLALLIAL